jgi:hypothetical protein
VALFYTQKNGAVSISNWRHPFNQIGAGMSKNQVLQLAVNHTYLALEPY